MRDGFEKPALKMLISIKFVTIFWYCKMSLEMAIAMVLSENSQKIFLSWGSDRVTGNNNISLPALSFIVC